MFTTTTNKIAEISSWVFQKLLIAVPAAIIMEVVGQNWLGVKVLTILIFLDIISGAVKGLRTGSFSSWKLIAKIGALILYLTAFLAAHQVSRLAPGMNWLQDAIGVYFAITEMVSILENAYQAGLPIPTKIKNLLEKKLDKNGKPPHK